MSKGWECPRCGDVYGPHVKKCENENCKKAPRALESSGDPDDAVDIDPGDLHDQLYRPTINQFPDGTRSKKRGGGGGGGDGGSGQSDGSTGIY